MMRIKLSQDAGESRAVIKAIGVGGAGGNAINRMVMAGMQGVELIAANSDAQALRASQAELKLQMGETLTRGLGVGGDSAKGRMAALESEPHIREVLGGADMIFITAGMGGGTGTGGAPVVAKLSKEMGALTIGVVTRPFRFEGLGRAQIAELGIQEMRQNVDALLVIPNEKLFDVMDKDASSEAAFSTADDVLRKSVQSISDLITTSGHINTDLNDLRAIMKDAGEALIGMGEASGSGRAARAAKQAVESPLLENVVIDGAKGLIVNMTGRKASLKFFEMDEVMKCVSPRASPDAKIKVGKVYDESLGDNLRITVIATGFPQKRGLRPGLALRQRSLTGVPQYSPSAAFNDGLGAEFQPLGSGSPPEDWIKPAFLRLRARKLK